MGSLISMDEVYKIYNPGINEVRALDGVTLRIEKGEFIAIVGHSGSGKSTLMNIMGCLDTPTSGTYELSGEKVGNLKESRLSEIRNRIIGFVFQNFNLIPSLSAIENVELPLLYKGMRKEMRHRVAAEALERVGLKDRMNHRPYELSGGQQQRVAVARAIAAKPPIILADEPTGNLDSKSGKEVLELLKELNAEGRTVVLITHDMSIAEQAGRIIRICDGRIIGSDAEQKTGT
ncbi:putative ABC transporter ATP-binding protein TM_0352 [[Clostridium] cellulosi]|uniref:Putative ABC transporter ATP-binding protein TM_0352 n=1 Tax=[Clostridium] cellulosi TaxID=29343 RepID=A0A078KU85_9FIRM|nr:putative ABC transporter ATP-binding protein TM_0352 [[Clostridium] cellulosi]